MARHDEAKAGGLFDRIGNFVVRWPLIVIGCWIAVAAALTLLLPTLQAQAAKREQAPLPPGAPSMVLQKEMSAAFQEKIETSALLLVLLTNENGLGPADEAVYRKLIENLRADTQDKISVQDFLAVPEMKELLASKDNKAWNLPITFAGDAASPETQAAFKRVAAIVKQTVAGTSLTVHLSGPIATVADLTELGEKDVRIIEIGTAVSVLIILILVYRNLVTMLVPLATIGASVVTAQGTLSGLAEFGLAVNMQAIVFMSAVMIGAGTDYAVFLISRYHDYVRHGEKSDMAVKKALMSIGKVITASAATVAVTFLAMVFTKLEVFSAVGPAIAVAITVSLLGAVTLLPAILTLTGRRGWIKPRRDLTSRMWRHESPHGIRIGVIRTVGSTGGVITSAGLIFAASMFGLVGASINTMAQAGFTIGIGIVLDTFLVRTVTVPALTTMIGRANWWPSELGRDPSTPPTKADRWLRRVKGHRRKAPIPAPKPPHTKVVRNTNGHASKAATKSVPNGKPADLAEGNGEYLIDHLRRHSLPLFGYAAMPAYDVVDGVSKPNGDGAHIGKEPVDHLLGHSLPLFGLAGLPSYDRWDDTSIGEPAVGHAGSKPDAKLST